MEFNEERIAASQDQQLSGDKPIPGGRRVDNGAGLNQADLENTFLSGKNDMHPNPTEGKGMGGHNFGKENLTPAGNDKNNPTQMAGHTNAYLNRDEPSDEHPENSNFKPAEQEGMPDYDKAQPYAQNTDPKPEKVERGNGENDRPNTSSPYREGREEQDNDEENNIPGPQELPDQQKVGEDDGDEHIET